MIKRIKTNESSSTTHLENIRKIILVSKINKKHEFDHNLSLISTVIKSIIGDSDSEIIISPF